MIDPGIWQSQDFGKLPTLAKLVFIGLFSQADDEGRGRANPQYIKNTLFPYEEMRKSDIDSALAIIATHMSIVFYTCDDNEYYALTNWRSWQKVEKPQQSRLPSREEGALTKRESVGAQTRNGRETIETVMRRKEADGGGYSANFETFWAAYPRKDEKGGAYKQYQARLNNGFSEEDILSATKAYAQQCRQERTERKYIKQAKTFVGPSTPFCDYLPPQTAAGSAMRKDPFAEAERDLQMAEISTGGEESARTPGREK